MTLDFTWWKDGDFFVGHLKDYPDYQTQGTTLEDLKLHLSDLHHDLANRLVP